MGPPNPGISGNLYQVHCYDLWVVNCGIGLFFPSSMTLLLEVESDELLVALESGIKVHVATFISDLVLRRDYNAALAPKRCQ